MPISKSAAILEKKRSIPFHNSSRIIQSQTENVNATDKEFLTIAPALPPDKSVIVTTKQCKRSHSTLSSTNLKRNDSDSITLQLQSDGNLHVSRTQKEKEKNQDRISLDRRGLTTLPIIDNETRLRLLSLQHNLLNTLEAFRNQNFPFLVFLDIYDNQLERICCLDTLENVRVLLIGKNRIKKIEGLTKLIKIEVLDLHGNQIQHVAGLETLKELKVLNLASNQLRAIGANDFHGLISLQELNLRRNRIKKLLGFGETPQLQKLFISNNEIQTVEDMSSIAKATVLKEIAIDNNPVSLGGDCVSFLVSYLPHLINLNSMQVTEQVRKAANAWRRNKESSNKSFMELTSDINSNVRREEVISNARTNWELLRSQTRCLSGNNSATLQSNPKNLKPGCDIFLTSLSKPAGINRVKQGRALLNNVKVPILPDKKLGLLRTSSQDTTSSNTSSNNELFRLPPIQVSNNNGVKLSSSLSSIGPNVDSSVSSLLSDDSSQESDDDSSHDSEPEPEEVKTEASKPEEAGGVVKEQDGVASVVVNKTTPRTDSSSNLSSSTASISNITLPSSASDVSNSRSSLRNRSVKSAVSHKAAHSKTNGRAVTAKPKPNHTSPAQCNNNNNNSERDREQGGDYLIEICGRHLNVYGQGGLRFIDKTWSSSKANDVNTVNFNYVNFNNIAGVLAKIKQRFPNIEHFVFKETNIISMGQLNALAEVQGLTSVTIDKEGNAITSKNWETYAIYRLSHWGLKFINGKEITEEDINLANTEYQALSDLVLWSLPDILLHPLLIRLHLDVNPNKEWCAKKWLLKADPALRSVVSKEALQWKKGTATQDDLNLRQKAKLHMTLILDEMTNTINKLRLLDEQWPGILNESVRNTLLDYSHLNLYMKRKMQELK